jgi:hypothetical protein
LLLDYNLIQELGKPYLCKRAIDVLVSHRVCSRVISLYD